MSIAVIDPLERHYIQVRHLEQLKGELYGLQDNISHGAFTNPYGWDLNGAKGHVVQHNVACMEAELKAAAKRTLAEKQREKTEAEQWRDESRQYFTMIEKKVLTAINREVLKQWRTQRDNKKKHDKEMLDAEVKHMGRHMTATRHYAETVSMSQMAPSHMPHSHMAASFVPPPPMYGPVDTAHYGTVGTPICY